jgi:ribonuclease III
MNNLQEFEKIIEHTFADPLLLKQAFVHRSYLNENPSCEVGHNERLEFLGDAVIELVVTKYLYTNYPDEPEGIMTNWRAALVNAVMLATVARDLHFEQYLFLSRGESEDKGKARQYILANAFEAVVGALYLDAGYDAAKVFLEKHLLSNLKRILDEKSWIDPKSRFQEAAQEKLGITPSYRVLKEVGPDHARQFTIGVYIGKELIAEGEGSSKQEAQVAAAERAIEEKDW